MNAVTIIANAFSPRKPSSLKITESLLILLSFGYMLKILKPIHIHLVSKL